MIANLVLRSFLSNSFQIPCGDLTLLHVQGKEEGINGTTTQSWT